MPCLVAGLRRGPGLKTGLEAPAKDEGCALSAAATPADEGSRHVVAVFDGVDDRPLSRDDGRDGESERFDPADEVAP